MQNNKEIQKEIISVKLNISARFSNTSIKITDKQTKSITAKKEKKVKITKEKMS